MRRVAEWILAVIAATVCIAVSLFFSSQGRLRPVTGLYLIEITLFGGLGLLAVARNRENASGWAVVPWMAAGLLLAFVVLGAATLGLFLAPAALALLFAGYLADLRLRRRVTGHVALLLGAAVAQAGIMWLAIPR